MEYVLFLDLEGLEDQISTPPHSFIGFPDVRIRAQWKGWPPSLRTLELCARCPLSTPFQNNTCLLEASRHGVYNGTVPLNRQHCTISHLFLASHS